VVSHWKVDRNKTLSTVTDQADVMANTFKQTFSRTVKIHFIGVWSVLLLFLGCIDEFSDI
jgi:hypothetical protein